MGMYLYAITGLINASTSLILGILVLIKDKKAPSNHTFALFCLAIFTWSFSYFFWQLSETSENALFWSRCLMAGAIFIPVFFTHFVLIFLKEQQKKRKFLVFSYLIFIFFFAINFSPLFISGVSYKLSFKFWPEPGILFHPFLMVWLIYTAYCIGLLYKFYRKVDGIKKFQIKYILIGTIIGFIGGSTNYFLWYDVLIPPVGNILVVVFVISVGYSILRYKLLEIRLIINNGLIYFLSVCISFGTGTLFILMTNDYFNFISRKNQILVLVIVSIVIFIILQKALINFSNHLWYGVLDDARKVEKFTKRLSKAFDLNKIIKQSYKIILETTKSERVLFLRYEKSMGLKLVKLFNFSESEKTTLLENIRKSSKELLLIGNEASFEYVFSYNYLRTKENKEIITNFLDKCKLKVLIPLRIKSNIIGFMMAGEKVNGEIYTEQDIQILRNLSDRIAIAMENTNRIQELKNEKGKVRNELEDEAEWNKSKRKMLKESSAILNSRFNLLKDLFEAGTKIKNAEGRIEILGQMEKNIERYLGDLEEMEGFVK